MTTKQIAEFCEVSTKTVRRWVDKLSGEAGHNVTKLTQEKFKMMEAGENGKPVDWTDDEVKTILIAGGRGCVVRWMENGQNNAPQNAIANTQTIADIVRETITAMVPALIAIVKGAVPEKAALALPAAPAMSMRDQLRRVINQYAHETGDHRGAWQKLYQEFYYRHHRNLKECAKNRGIDTLDYVEDEGLMPDLLAVALAVLAPASTQRAAV